MITLCVSRTSRYDDSPSRWIIDVEPSISVNTKVTIPVGNCGIGSHYPWPGTEHPVG